MYCKIKFWDVGGIVKWYGISNKMAFWYGKIEYNRIIWCWCSNTCQHLLLLLWNRLWCHSLPLERKSFTVQVYGPKIAQQPIIFGAIMWKYGDYMVRSPLVVYSNLPGSQYGYASFSTSQEKPDSKGSSMYHKNRILKHKYWP